MAYNRNFYNNFYEGKFTFHNPYPNSIPVPPAPPGIPFSVSHSALQITDQEFVENFEQQANKTQENKSKLNSISIKELREKLYAITSSVNEIQQIHTELSENVAMYTEDKWNTQIESISIKKASIDELMLQLSGTYINFASKCLAKRKAKRSRLKRLNEERKQQRDDRIKESKERSRKIDENLQKIKNDILKVKQEETAKQEADLVLKDVHRKKVDAKKCLVKLEAVMKLRQARHNTAKGRGQSVPEHEGNHFENNIEKLKTLWIQKLKMYDKEENNLRAQLKNTLDKSIGEDEREIDSNLRCWREVLFGGSNPQFGFNGSVEKFIAVRTAWDLYIDEEGSSLPIGWVTL